MSLSSISSGNSDAAAALGVARLLPGEDTAPPPAPGEELDSPLRTEAAAAARAAALATAASEEADDEPAAGPTLPPEAPGGGADEPSSSGLCLEAMEASSSGNGGEGAVSEESGGRLLARDPVVVLLESADGRTSRKSAGPYSWGRDGVGKRTGVTLGRKMAALERNSSIYVSPRSSSWSRTVGLCGRSERASFSI